MCSICGMVNFDGPAGDSECILKMGGTMTYRGPDQSGAYVADHAVLHHNRLAIIDVERGIQPMTRFYKGKSYTIIYNGEIYNSPELRREIEASGVTLMTDCDTEIVLYSYILYGRDCASRLNGIFAFAVLDELANEIYLARDRFGIKPLFYTLAGDTLLFASEIKALLNNPLVSRKVDKIGLWQLLFLAPTRLCGSGIFRDISEVEPAHYAVFDESGLHFTRYWQLAAEPFSDTPEQAAEHTRELMLDAVCRQLVSDVPLCTFLSGGLDSTAVTAIAAREYQSRGRKLSTYSFEYEGNKQYFDSTLFQPQGDDDFATFAARRLGTDHTVLTLSSSDVADALETATLLRDMPGHADIDSSLYLYCREVKRRHTVALSGECADEIFGGYPWFYRPEMLNSGFFPWVHDPMVRANLFRADFAQPREGLEYMREQYRHSIAQCPVLDTDSDEMITARRATWLSSGYFMTSLLERKDRMSMGSSVEVRVPFADHRIIEYVFNVPWSIKFENGVEKALLRNAMAGIVPEKILHRKKSPYPKTHNPQYELIVAKMLSDRMAAPDSVIAQVLDKNALERFLMSDNTTWLGQLMSRPQMLAWLVQFDIWAKKYNVEFV